ncbi:hypothetical protein BLNAU_16383 [Blattamonas nauphoetae]|uniref:Uncharacterized protein n=1 Tax=Blattamonas nauphoetae TaxID=2049346 RepID=A0ABQ9XDA7_9EUKA|nr:hypothetical protein BLNAU_16383 [Blattamonas nauphoetae]
MLLIEQLVQVVLWNHSVSVQPAINYMLSTHFRRKGKTMKSGNIKETKGERSSQDDGMHAQTSYQLHALTRPHQGYLTTKI